MKKLTFTLILILLIFAGKVSGQCTATLSVAGTDNQTICISSSLTDISYSTTDITSASFTGLPAGVTGIWSSNTATISGTPTESGIFSYTITYTGTGGCTSTGTITIKAIPTASVSGSSTICENGSATVSGASASNGTILWTEDGFGSITSGATTLTPTYTSATGDAGKTVTLTMTVSNSPCTAVNAVYTVIVKELPNPAITGLASVCTGTTGVLYTTEPGMTGYIWEIPSGGSITSGSGTNEITVTWSTPGARTVKVNYTNTNSCMATAPASYGVTVHSLPTPSIAGLASVCVGTTGVTYTTESGMTGYSWAVSSGGSITGGSGTHEITVTWTTSGARTVSVNYTGTSSCTAIMPSVYNVTVNSLPAPSITGISTICAGATGVTYTTESGMTGYNWAVSSGGSITGGLGTNELTVTWNADGPQTVSINYSDAAGCSATSAAVRNITVNPLTGDPVFTTGAVTICKDAADETYTATASNSTSLVYSVYPSGSSGAGTINAGTGVMNWKSSFSGTATITATATGICGTTTTDRVVTVYPSVPAQPGTITGSSIVCQGQTGVSYSISAVTNSTYYSWIVPAGGTITSGQGTTSITVDFAAGASDLAISVRAQNNCGPGTARNLSVTVNPTPTATISGTTTVCHSATSPLITFGNPQTLPVTITYNINGASQTTINVGAGTSATAAAPTTFAGTYIYSLVSVAYQTGATCSNNITGTATVSVTPDVGTPTAITIAAGSDPACQLTNGSTTTSYATTAANSTGFNWSLSTGSAGSINSSGVMTWNSGFSGNVNIQVTAVGCGTSSQVIRTVSVTPAVGTPTSISVIAGSEPACQLTDGATTTSYSTTATYSTGFNWSLSNSAAGSMNSASGVMTWANGFSGSVNILVTASGCGTSSQVIRTVAVTPHVGTPVAITVSAGSEPVCQLTNATTTTTYTTSAANSTGFNWSLSNGAAGSINAASGVMTWADGFSGSVNIQVTATGCNSTSSQVIRAVSVTPAVGTPAAIAISAGSDPACQLTNGSTMTIYITTATNSTGFNWSLSNAAAGSINPVTGVMIWANGFSGNVNIQVSANGCGTSSQVIRPVTVNPLPVPIISGPAVTRVTSLNNVYTTDLFKSNYVWAVSGGGSVTSGGTSTSSSITVNWNISGAQTVSVSYTGDCTSAVPKVYNVTVNPLPVASSVSITGTPAIGFLLTGNHTYTDVSPEGISRYRWLRNGTTEITGAISNTYTPTIDDLNKTITFEVTPVTSSGIPDAGTPVKSAPTGFVENLSEMPVADEVCIEGIRAGGNTLKGKYRFLHSKPEGASTYQWYRNGMVISGATAIQYNLLQAEDIDSNADITFEVTPVSSNIIPVTGTAASSNPLAKITLPQDEYSVAVSEVILTANQPGGVFSGPAVTDGKFSPSSAGITGSPYLIQYLLNIVNTSTSCSQKAAKQVKVVTNTTTFDGFNTVYCHDGGQDVISVIGIPSLSTSYGFSLTNPDGIVSQTDWTVTIDPGKMRPGVNTDVLTFYYLSAGYLYRISQPFVIDSVGTDIKIINLNLAYCKEDPKQTISVVGAFPSGGTAIWAGDLLSNLKTTSADLDPQTGIPGQIYSLTYQYRTPSGCLSNIVPKLVTVNPLPDPAFTIDPTYNIDGGPETLVPVQSGGSFSGNGISGNRFFPDIAGLGEHTITYSITDSNNCSDNLSLKTTIRKAQGIYTDLPSVICYRDTTYNVKITGLPAGMTANSFDNTKHTLIYSPGATSADYNVPSAGAGADTLVFSYKYESVDYSVSKVVEVDSLGQVTIQNLIANDVICNNIAPFELFTSLKGGVFTGPVVGGYLDPAKAIGPTLLSYKYTNQKTGCSTAIDIPFTIISAPAVSFAPVDYCIDNKSDSTRFINTTTSAGLINEWLWEFSDPGGSTFSNKRNPSYLYKTGGLHSVTLTAKTANNCTVTRTFSVDLGIKPKADFYWKNDCYHPNDSIMLFDNSSSDSPITSRSWKISGGAEFSTKQNPKFLKTDTGYLSVRYTVNTSYAGCYHDTLKTIYVRPSISLASDDYFQNFETGGAGWIISEDSKAGWSFGKPDTAIINGDSAGNNAWFTPLSLINQKVISSVVSPCFDFSASERPMIDLRIWRQFVKEMDGAVLQYKISDSLSWHPVGTLEDGIYWYNSTMIKGKPGGDQIGWTTKGMADTSWIQARHTLDDLKGKKDVKFRISYGSEGTSTESKGIAFDEIWIGERTRKVLLEHFSNTSSSRSREATEMVNDITLDKKEDVINIQYHTNFPGADQLYDYNPGDASARILFYGLTRAPYSFLDGGNNSKEYANIFDYNIADIDSNDVTRRSLLKPVFDIAINTVVTGSILTVNGQITSLRDISSDNLTLYIAVTEKEYSGITGANGETVFYNTFRKFIPDAGGITLKKKWLKDENIPLPEKTWVIEKTLNSSDIEIIAFIQNSVTKEVYQVASEIKKDLVVGIENQFQGKGAGIAIYPNPAVNKLTIGFKEPLTHKTDIRIYDLRGIVVYSYKAGAGVSEITIENPGLRGGIYMVRVSSGGVDYGFKKLIVSGE